MPDEVFDSENTPGDTIRDFIRIRSPFLISGAYITCQMHWSSIENIPETPKVNCKYYDHYYVLLCGIFEDLYLQRSQYKRTIDEWVI